MHKSDFKITLKWSNKITYMVKGAVTRVNLSWSNIYIFIWGTLFILVEAWERKTISQLNFCWSIEVDKLLDSFNSNVLIDVEQRNSSREHAM